MKHLGLFEGIGGFSLAARWMGWETVAYSEINPFCLKVLKHHFPEADVLTDIKTTDFKPYANRIDIITGGFPCQPYSTAGKRLGKEDERHLWPEMLRAIREISPRWVVGENVRGLTNWNGGMVFDEVQADLEAQGYEVLPFLLPACAVNAPHRRDRIWFIAYSMSAQRKWQEGRFQSESNDGDKGQNVTNCKNKRLQKRNAEPIQIETHSTIKRYDGFSRWQNFPTQSPVCGGNDGIPNRVDRIKALGNAIVPQVAYEIFKAIQQYELLNPESNPV